MANLKRYVLGFLFSSNKEFVFLIKKNRPDWQSGKLNGIGGHIELGELIDEAMTREFQEETGVLIKAWEYFGMMGSANKEGIWQVYLFTSVLPLNHNIPQTVTDEEVIAVRVTDLLLKGNMNIIPNLRWLIPMALTMDFKTCNIIY